MLFCTSVVPYTHTLLSGLTYKDQLHNPGAWLAEVTRMSAAELDRARWLSSFVRPSSGYPDIRELSAQLQSVSALHLMPLVALLLCWRNFAHPAHAPDRILRQQCRILAVTVGTGLALVAGGILVARAVIRAELIVETRQHQPHRSLAFPDVVEAATARRQRPARQSRDFAFTFRGDACASPRQPRGRREAGCGSSPMERRRTRQARALDAARFPPTALPVRPTTAHRLGLSPPLPGAKASSGEAAGR